MVNLLIQILLVCSILWGQQEVRKTWTQTLPTIGTFSSPRISDLNGDGTGDIILGGGREEFQASDTAVFALDGLTGELLWNVPAVDQIFGSATFLDVTGDGISDVFIGGRSAELIAIDGASGAELWRFVKANKLRSLRRERWFNFYNPQFIPDQDGDSLPDLLVSNGGDVMAEPYDPDRPAGSLAVISSASGSLLARADMPDGKETYFSVTVSPTPDSSDWEIVFGTGGETLGGNLYLGLLSQVMAGNLAGARKLHSSDDKGYIGPASRVDLNEDGRTEIILNTVNGRIMAIDGHTLQVIWETKLLDKATESYSSVAIGRFNHDQIPDFFVSHAIGTWPRLDWSVQAMVNGKTGEIEFMDSLGFYQNTTPITLDWNGDGYDEVLMSVNIQEVNELFQKFFYNILVLIDFQEPDIKQIGEVFEGSNLSSTPWVGDLDADQKLDIIYCHGTNLRHTYTFDGIAIKRLATQVPIRRSITWGSYQGSNYNGIFINSDDQ